MTFRPLYGVALGLAASLISFSAVAQSYLQVGEVTIGMPFSAVKEAMQKTNSDYKINEVLSSEKLVGYSASSDQSEAKDRDVMLVMAVGDRVGSISRYQSMSESNQIPGEGLRSALFEKYGQKPTSDHNSVGQINIQWERDREGEVANTRRSACVADSQSVFIENERMGRPGRVNGNCSVSVSVVAFKDSATQGVTKMKIDLVDEGAIYDKLLAEQEAQKAEEQARSNAIQGNKPKL